MNLIGNNGPGIDCKIFYNVTTDMSTITNMSEPSLRIFCYHSPFLMYNLDHFKGNTNWS